MEGRIFSSIIKSISLSIFLLLVGCSAPFKQRLVTDLDQDLALVEGDIAYKWRKYIFDIRIVDIDDETVPQFNTFNVVRQESASSNALLFASSIGSSSSDGPGVSVETITGLWEQPTMKRPQGAVYVQLYMENEPDDGTLKLSANSYRATAGFVCYTWAQKMNRTSLPSLLAEVLQNNADNWTQTLPLNIPIMDFSLWDLKTNQWESRFPLQVKVPFAPYRVGRHWIIPVEIEVKNPDFESNCL